LEERRQAVSWGDIEAAVVDHKERAKKFRQATQEPIDPQSYRVLAQIVEQMLLSDKM
jgi:hypothetical protein